MAFWLHHNWRTLDLSLGHCPQVSTVCRSLQWPQLNSFFSLYSEQLRILYIIGRDENQNSAPLSGSPWNNRIPKRTRRVTEPTVLPLNVPSLRSILFFFLFLCFFSREWVRLCVYVPLLIERHSVVISSSNQRRVKGNTHLPICHRLSSCQVKDNESGHEWIN